MKIHEYNEMMAYLTRPAPKVQTASLMDEYLGDQKEYQRAVDEGFQGTYEEFLRMRSMRETSAYGGRIGFDKGGMAKVVAYVESLPKGTTITTKMIEDYVSKNNLDVNVSNFFNRRAPNIKGYKFLTDTRKKDFKLTDTEKANIEAYGQDKYDKLKEDWEKFRVRQGKDVGALAPEKTQKVKFKKEYDKAIKYYKKRGVEPNIDSIRRNIARNDGKFTPGNIKLRGEAGLSSLLKNYEKADLIADLKKGKNLSEIAIEYLDKNEKQVLKVLEGKRDYSKPLGRISTELGNAIKADKEATKLLNKIKKENNFNKLKNKTKYATEVETLLPYAQEQGLVPKVNLKGVPIDTASKYFQYAYKIKRDPIAKLFGFYEKVGIEHPGGVARALIFDDAATLNEIVATMPDTNITAGYTYDTYATGQARFFEKTGDPKYIKKINQIILNKQKEFGKPRTILNVEGDKVTRRTTKFSLTNPNLLEDSKSFINEYIIAGGSKRKNFNKLDSSLQKSILAFEKGNKTEGNKFLKTALEDTGAKAELDMAMDKIKLNATIVGENAIAEGITVCTTGGGKVKKSSGGRIGYGKKCYSGQALMDFVRENPEEAMKAFKASKEVNASMAKNPSKWLKAGRLTARELGPLGILGGEILFGGALTMMELGQGKTVWEALDNGFLYGLAGVEDKVLLDYANKFNFSDKQKEYIKTALDVSKKAPAYLKILDTMSKMDSTKLTTTEPGPRGMGKGRERPTAYARYKTLADKKLAEINALKEGVSKDDFLRASGYLQGLQLAKEHDESWRRDEIKKSQIRAMENIKDYHNLNYDYEPYNMNQGGRVGLDKGSKPKNPGRRAFIKGLGALAVLPIVGKFFKMSDVASVAKRPKVYTGPAIDKVKGMPEWFPGLVKKLWNEGEDVTKKVAYNDRQVVKRGTLESGDDVDLIYDVGSGDVSINVTPKKGTYETGSGAYNREYSLDYRKGIGDESTKGTPPDEFGVIESRPVRTSKDDIELDWSDEMTVDEAMSDLTELEAFSKNKTTTQIHKKKGTKKKDVDPGIDPTDYFPDADF